MPPLCAICVRAPATAIDEIDGRKHPVCDPCITQETPAPPPPPPLKHLVLGVIQRTPGLDVLELADGLGMTSNGERNHVSQALCRLVRAGLARFEGTRNQRFYYPTESTR